MNNNTNESGKITLKSSVNSYDSEGMAWVAWPRCEWLWVYVLGGRCVHIETLQIYCRVYWMTQLRVEGLILYGHMQGGFVGEMKMGGV